MNIWIGILFLILWLVSGVAYPAQVAVEVANCLRILKAIPDAVEPRPRRLFGLLAPKIDTAEASPLIQLIQRTQALKDKFWSGEIGDVGIETHEQVDALIREALEVAKSQGESSAIIFAMARLHLMAKNQRWQRVEAAEYWKEKDLALEEFITKLKLNTPWKEAIKKIRTREHLTKGYDTKRVTNFQTIDLGSPGNGPSGSHYLERARRLMRTHAISAELIINGKLPLSNPELLQVAKILNAAKEFELSAPTPYELALEFGEAHRQKYEGSLLSPNENKLVSAYRATLAQEKAKNPTLSSLRTPDDEVHEELKALFDPKNPQRDNPWFNPKITLINRILAKPNRYREIINEVILHNPPASVTDTKKDRIFIHVPGIVKLTLEGQYRENNQSSGNSSEGIPEITIEGFEFYDYQKSEFGDYHLREKVDSNGKKKKKWEGDENNKACLQCHFANGMLQGSFDFSGKTIHSPQLRFTKSFSEGE